MPTTTTTRTTCPSRTRPGPLNPNPHHHHNSNGGSSTTNDTTYHNGDGTTQHDKETTGQDDGVDEMGDVAGETRRDENGDVGLGQENEVRTSPPPCPHPLSLTNRPTGRRTGRKGRTRYA